MMKTLKFAALAAVCTGLTAFSATKEVATEADDEGRVIVTEKEAKTRSDTSAFVMEPLGEEGHLKLNSEMPNKPTFRAKKPFEPGLRLFGAGGKDAVIVARHGVEVQRTLNELRWHLEEMIGRDVAVVPRFPDDGTPSIVIEFAKKLDVGEHSLVHVEGNVLWIEGTDGIGMSHALTYVLESLGCRYLWPGRNGKVIPKKQDVYLPKDIALDFVPSLKMRRIRDYFAEGESRVQFTNRKFGIDCLKTMQMRREAAVDHFENRSFWEWHGVNDAKALPGVQPMSGGDYRWEHRFNDYYERYGKSHPDWFAMQVNGKRDMDNRPCFCMSNPELIEQTAKDTIDLFKFEPGVVAHSLCLPDGGRRAFCFCENCRRLDPKNSPERLGLLHYPVVRPLKGYSFTDRVLSFKNAIAERVVAECPGKMLSMYAYSSYVEPPVKVRPHPALLIVSVAGGNYFMPGDRVRAHRSLAAWTTFGNKFVWRPNVLGSSRTQMPLNYSKWLFEDLETFKANNLLGTDFDCMNSMWATDGLNFYMLAKAHLNPDRLAYEDVYADYLGTAFGAAAPEMRKYYDYLFATYEKAGAKIEERRALETKRGRPIAGGNHANDYITMFDLDFCTGCLDRAETLAAGDDGAVCRIGFARRGLGYGRLVKRMSEAMVANDPALKDIQREAAEYIVRTLKEDPLALCPSNLAFYDRHLGQNPLGLAK